MQYNFVCEIQKQEVILLRINRLPLVMDKFHKQLVAVLGAISVIGVLGIPPGDPKFVIQALGLESCFITLAVLSAKNYKKVYIPNFIIAGIVIAGKSIIHIWQDQLSQWHFFKDCSATGGT